MTANDKIEKIQTHFQALSKIASSLNTASDELTSSVSTLGESLKQLNVGLTVWVTFRTRDDDEEPQCYDLDQIGYAKINGVWGIAIQNVYGDESRNDHHGMGPWLFNDAPRELRLASVDKLPELIEALAKEAFNTTKRVQEKAQQVRELAQAILNASVTEPSAQNVKPISGVRELLEKKTLTPHDQAKAERIANLLVTKKDGGQ
jgi:prefoldin subunit 5